MQSIQGSKFLKTELQLSDNSRAKFFRTMHLCTLQWQMAHRKYDIRYEQLKQKTVLYEHKIYIAVLHIYQ